MCVCVCERVIHEIVLSLEWGIEIAVIVVFFVLNITVKRWQLVFLCEMRYRTIYYENTRTWSTVQV